MSGISNNYTPFVPQVNTAGTEGTQRTDGITNEKKTRSLPPPDSQSMLSGDAHVSPGNSAGFNPRLVTEDMISANRVSFNISNVLILIAQTMMESRKDQRAAWVQQAQNILATGQATADQMKQAAAWKLGGALASASVSAATAGVSGAMAAYSLGQTAKAQATIKTELADHGLKLEKVDTKAVDAEIDVQAQAQKIVADNPGLELSDTSTPKDVKSATVTSPTDSTGTAGAADADQTTAQTQQAESKAKLDDTSKQLDERSVSDKTLETEAKTTETKAAESRDQINDKQLEVDTKKEALKVVEDNPDLALEEGGDKATTSTDAKAGDGKAKSMSNDDKRDNNKQKIENNRRYYDIKGALMREKTSEITARSERNNAIASVLKAGVDAVAAGSQSMADIINADVELLRSKRDYQSQLASAQLDFANEARDLLSKTLDMMQSIEAARHKATGAINNV